MSMYMNGCIIHPDTARCKHNEYWRRANQTETRSSNIVECLVEGLRSFGVVDRDVLGEGGAITMSSSVVIMVGGGSAR